ncbi:hypothetical protein [Chiayiivirga flava]|uniref:Uncharacterized protein n=1 Tax=Chiayiivirga flava TaxID=659595 RepID=A0A7W8D777_9GAMM|nr:hypothetical protein [Chiayiivirga flava]MBB5208812.1 hypothetical protein [Chiayiivirga flava]
MSDRPESGRGPLPAQALRALPLATPPRSAWPAIAAQLPAAARAAPRPRMMRWAALAAALAVLCALPLWRDGTPTDPVRPTTPVLTEAGTGPISDPLDALLRESAQLEAWLAWSGNLASESGASVSVELDVRDRIATIDALLGRPDLDPAAQLPLLQERLVRLRQLAGLHNTRQLLAANGDEAMAAPVAVF